MLQMYNDILRIEDICEILSICSNTAYDLIHSRQLKAFRCGKSWKIQKSDLIDYIHFQVQNQK